MLRSSSRPAPRGWSVLFVGVLCAAVAIAAPIAQAQAQGQAQGQTQGQPIRIGGTGAAQGLMQLLADAYRAGRPDAQIEVLRHSLGSSGGIRALLGGALDVAMSARLPKEDEATDDIVAIPFGRTALAFVTSRQDAAQALTSMQVLAIYRLETQNWPDGVPARIILRPKGESDNDLLTQHLPGLDVAISQLRQLQSIPTAITDQDNLDLAETLRGSLAASSLSAVLSEKRRVRTVALDGVSPTTENVANGSYPLVKMLYMLVRVDAPPSVRDFVEFVQSATGRAILQHYGTLPAGP